MIFLRDLHILPFRQPGSSKYELLGKAYDLVDVQEDNAERIEACKRYAESKGLRVSVGGSGFKNHEEALR
jgi:pyruvate-formate lyase-activating enzyme